VAALCDETAFWRSDDSANPAEEILAALRPAMATIPGAILIGIGSPYRRSGVMYDAWKRHYGKDDSPVLVLQADTRTMNPTVPQSVIDEAMERDPAAASAEYLAQFRSDVAAFLDADLIERAVEAGVRERPPRRDLKYGAAADMSGGVTDAAVCAIGHRSHDGRIVLNACRGVPAPHDPSAVVKEFCHLLRSYRCFEVMGDKYGAQWTVEAFSKHGIHYRHSERSKSELYLEALPLFTTGTVNLLDYPPLLRELQQLERKSARSGKDSVDHPPQGHELCERDVRLSRVVGLGRVHDGAYGSDCRILTTSHTNQGGLSWQ
jgi:hypothetical protein